MELTYAEALEQRITERLEQRLWQRLKAEVQALVRAAVRDMESRVRAEAESETSRQNLETIMVERFGPLPSEIGPALTAAGTETLHQWIRRAATAATFDEVGISPKQPEV